MLLQHHANFSRIITILLVVLLSIDDPCVSDFNIFVSTIMNTPVSFPILIIYCFFHVGLAHEFFIHSWYAASSLYFSNRFLSSPVPEVAANRGSMKDCLQLSAATITDAQKRDVHAKASPV